MKYTLKYSKVLLLLTGMMLILTDCKKDKFLNVNNNPNFPANVPINQLLPTCEANIAYMMGNTLAIYGGLWAQYWTQDPTYGSQYGAFDSYVNLPTDNDIVWSALYTNATSLNTIIANADSTQKNYVAIAYFMKAYTFQVLTDGWGDVPCSQALQGNANLAAKFDPGQQVYDSVVTWINTGMKLINLQQTSPPEDLIYTSASMTSWQKFANTLLLKVYLRECLKNPAAAAAGIRTLTAQMAANGTSFMSVTGAPESVGGDDAAEHYLAITLHASPLAAVQAYFQVQNLTASATTINYMLATNDPRIQDFYQLDANGGYGGEPQGDYINLGGQPDYGFSPVSTEVISSTAPIRLLTVSESDFLQAEAAARGYLTASASTLYAAGIAASFASWSNAHATGAAGIANYLAGDSVNFARALGTQGQLKLILTQKWISMCGSQNFEAWTEWRRTRYPTFFTQSLASRIPAGDWPRRLVYPDQEFNSNTNFPGLQPIYAAVWWDIN